MAKYFSFNPDDPIFGEILNIIEKQGKIKKILDVGCGNGFLMQQIKEKFPKIKVKGVDTDKELLKHCKKEGFDVKNGNILDLPFKKEEFDLVIGKDIVEHVQDNNKAMSELIRVSKKYIFISCPAPFTDAAWGDFTHIRPYTKTTLEHIAQIFNLKPINISSTKRKLPFRIIAKLWMQPIDDIAVYALYEK